ncbi:hypothetical protein OOT55_04505 [Marinimicrobium sp. C6131]|uniref:hypothetical protein n=1 Tax=Marinimicrobium sp. C6131 TaxID=3022676 RepID=UPI00223E555B|nr:hypothetical protein [Marinimicrobium sp. C6131]UZJ45322.1 hypothetical protein OOT55_04505 [Marinimicrobium sp. C6131]
MNRYVKTVFLSSLLMAGCGSDESESDDPTPGDADDFSSQIKEASGSNATDCGTVYRGDSEDRNEEEIEAAQNCALDAYLDYQPFFVIFRQDGLNEADYSGYAYDGYSLYSGTLYYEDGTPPGQISVTECAMVNINDYGFQLECVRSQ